jgi:SH3-like domain-containing protein
MRKRLLALAILAGLLTGGPALAIEYRSVATPAILYDAPSDKGKKLYVIARQTPVEVVVSLDKWVKVRDMGGGLSWIERGSLSDHRTLQVSAARATVRQKPEDGAPPVFEVARDVVLDLAEPPAAGWVKVRHREGLSGYLRVVDVWGL